MITPFRKNGMNSIDKSDNSFEKAESSCKLLGLQFTFRSIKFMLDLYGITFGQLRMATFYNEHGAYYCPEEAAELLIKAGLIGSKQVAVGSLDDLNEKTDKIISNWITNVGSLSLLYFLLIKQMEDRHFFMSGKERLMISRQKYSSSLQEVATHLEMNQRQIATLTAVNFGKAKKIMGIKS